MAIPNLKATYEVRAKVRTGEKRKSERTGKEYPASVDYFLSDDAEFKALGDKPQAVRIIFPYAEVEDNFSTGMEWWVKTKTAKSQLACYTKDAGSEPVALRLEPYVNEDNVAVGEQLRQGRVPIRCPFRECPQFKSKDCKPMGRLVFFLQGGRTDAVLEHDTKSWNSIERLTATLSGARMQGPLTGRVFELSVAFAQRGTDRFPLLSLREVDVEIKTEADAGLVDAVIAHEQAVAEGLGARQTLARMLDQAVPAWRENEEVLKWVVRTGYDECIAALLRRAA